ncbi:hypothetical protein ACFQJ7_05005 [Halovenus rubra]|uniref:Uncharacterized protein n=2 Tax=Halovenus rubra TaxID=869890 RepID=A0ACC7E142_9EURY|nr:hypothetical protein [Halovenus rubra]
MLPLLLCLGVLIIAGGSVVAAAGSGSLAWSQEQQSNTSIIAVENSSNYLSPPVENVTQQTYKTATLDVSGAVQGDALRLQGAQEVRRLGNKLATTDDAEGDAMEILQRLKQNARTLEQQKRQLYREYGTGEMKTEQLFREIVRLGVTADQYVRLAETVKSGTPALDRVSSQYSSLMGEFALLPSPIVSHLESGFTTGGQTPLYVQGGNESLVLATVQGDTFLRQATLPEQRKYEIPLQFGDGERSEADDAFARAQALYPWAVSDAAQSEVRGFGDTAVYRLQASHTHGELQTYVDGGTTNPFYELQEKNPFSVPVTDFTQTTENGLRLDVQLTNPTGPMRVEIIETADLDAQNITLSIDDEELTTLSSGEDFYTIQPLGPFEITAQTDAGDQVSVLVFP